MAAVPVPEGYAFPAAKLLAPEQINAISADAPVGVLATCGSYNPIHTGHTAMFDAGRVALEKQGVVIAGGFLSPVSDHYKKDGLAPFAPRMKICDAALSKNAWVAADPWEGMQPQYTRSYIVLSHIMESVKATYAGMGDAGQAIVPRLRIYFLCGGDLFETFYKPGVWVLSLLKKIFSEFFLCCVVREGSANPHDVMAKSEPLTHKDEPGVELDMAQFTDRVVIATIDPPNNSSSTEVRKLIAAGAPFGAMVEPETEELLRSGVWPIPAADKTPE